MNPKPTPNAAFFAPLLKPLEERIERLEELVSYTGSMQLFWVESKDTSYLVAAPDFEAVRMAIPLQQNIDFLGRASSQYDRYTVIKIFAVNNW